MILEILNIILVAHCISADIKLLNLFRYAGITSAVWMIAVRFAIKVLVFSLLDFVRANNNPMFCGDHHPIHDSQEILKQIITANANQLKVWQKMDEWKWITAIETDTVKVKDS